MRVCEGLVRHTQVYKPDGSVRMCPWLKSEFMNVGKLTEQTMEEIWRNDKVKNIFERQAAGDFSICNPDACAFLLTKNGKTDNVPFVEIDEIPQNAVTINLAFEKTCDYRCTVCAEAGSGFFDKHDVSENENYEKIKKSLEPVMPYLKGIRANGGGEVFASKHTLELLAN